MNKIHELSLVLPFLAIAGDIQSKPCNCCETVVTLSALGCSILNLDGDWLIAWVCRDCLAEVMATNGDSIKRGVPITEEKIDATLLSAAEWLDGELLERNRGEPFVRRPTFAENQRASNAGQVVPEGAAVVVSRENQTHLRRRPLPMPFPWKADSEWMVGAGAACEALAIADAIDSGEATALILPGGNGMVMAEQGDAMTIAIQETRQRPAFRPANERLRSAPSSARTKP